jgi:hypothetical protein
MNRQKKNNGNANNVRGAAKGGSRKNLEIERRELSFRVIKELYRDIDGHSISKSEKHKFVDPTCKSLTYGEIVPQSFAQILELVNDGNGITTSFVDLGCGTGRAVLTAALSTSRFQRCWGIELMPGLVSAANDVREAFYSQHIGGLLEHEVKSVVEEHNNCVTNVAVARDSKDEVILCIVSILSETSGNQLAAEALANKVCLVLGHKRFKQTMKSFKVKKFISLLKLFPEKFEVVELLTDVMVLLVAASAEEDAVLEEDTGDGQDMLETGQPNESGVSLQLRSAANGIFIPVPNVEFLCGDIFEIDWWTTATVAYCASLLFTDAMMAKLSVLVCQMQLNSWFITLKPLLGMSMVRAADQIIVDGIDAGSRSDKGYELIHDSFFKMSWQMARVYVYRIVSS